MKYEQHISQIVHNANVRANLILRSFVSLDPVILTKAFVTYVSLLEYYTPVWSPRNNGLIKKLESVVLKCQNWQKLHLRGLVITAISIIFSVQFYTNVQFYMNLCRCKRIFVQRKM